jgi:hypothetical protein
VALLRPPSQVGQVNQGRLGVGVACGAATVEGWALGLACGAETTCELVTWPPEDA